MFGGIVVADLVIAAGLSASESQAIGCGAGCGVGDCSESDDSADDDCCCTSATSANERVALVVVWLHGHGRESEICAVNADHCCLCETSARVGGLDGGVD